MARNVVLTMFSRPTSRRTPGVSLPAPSARHPECHRTRTPCCLLVAFNVSFRKPAPASQKPRPRPGAPLPGRTLTSRDGLCRRKPGKHPATVPGIPRPGCCGCPTNGPDVPRPRSSASHCPPPLRALWVVPEVVGFSPNCRKQLQTSRSPGTRRRLRCSRASPRYVDRSL